MYTHLVSIINDFPGFRSGIYQALWKLTLLYPAFNVLEKLEKFVKVKGDLYYLVKICPFFIGSRFENSPFLLSQNSKCPPFLLGQSSKFTLFIESKFQIHPFSLGQDSNFTPFYWVKVQKFPLFIGSIFKISPLLIRSIIKIYAFSLGQYSVNLACFARKLFWAL